MIDPISRSPVGPRRVHRGIALWLLLFPCLVCAGPVTVTTGKMVLEFSTIGGTLSRLEVCHPACDQSRPGSITTFRFHGETSRQSPIAVVIPGDDAMTRQIAGSDYSVDRSADDAFVTLIFESAPVESGVSIRKVYRISRTSYDIRLTIEVTGENRQRLASRHPPALRLLGTGDFLTTRESSGFAESYEGLSPVYAVGDDASVFDTGEDGEEAMTLSAPFWAGLRNRFWALLAHPVDPGRIRVTATSDEQTSSVTLSGAGEPPVHRFLIYAGPLQLDELKATSPSLTAFLYAPLWFWLRWLCFALYYPLTLLYHVTGNYGIAIILLAVVVKIAMSPLTAIADRWQRKVDTTRSALQPHLDVIKRNFRGEEQVKRIHALYGEHGTNMFYTLKSLFGFLIQIPVFIAAFYMLNENFLLSGVPFLWIDDLAQPDHFIRLPFTLPFFGEYLNLMPFVMTGVTLLASLSHDSGALSQDLRRKQRNHLFVMALLFFVLLYTFPAGMVLYWTSNNLIQLAKDLAGRVLPDPQ
ncbi:MAG: YidC/Oxa1 family insertase periplasmic-domain containing protein [Pseudomonadota bacterium]|nr:YidC/Oxa1 family insertase periplasmic-domain containing protein [Pseudomonadota bacterium]